MPRVRSQGETEMSDFAKLALAIGLILLGIVLKMDEVCGPARMIADWMPIGGCVR
jgi:hypothetical protein